MRFSLIVASIGRSEELQALLASLGAQSHQDFEVIVVDQNVDDRLAWIELRGQYAFAIRRIRSGLCHSSYARNVGLMEAAGEIVAFPDDDCVYPKGLLAQVNQAFQEHSDLGVRTGPAASPNGSLGSGRWQKRSSDITVGNVWNCVIEFNIFIRRDLATLIGGFDEQLGVGGMFGSAEGNDMVLRPVQKGLRGWYDTTQLAVHPDKSLSATAVARAFRYGAGLGYVLRKHNVPGKICLSFLIRPLCGCLLSLMIGRVMNATYYWRTLSGRVYGFSSYSRNQTRLR